MPNQSPRTVAVALVANLGVAISKSVGALVTKSTGWSA